MEARVMREAGQLAAALGVPLEDRLRCPPPRLSRLQKTGRWPSFKASGHVCVSTPCRCVSRRCKMWSVADASRSMRRSGICCAGLPRSALQGRGGGAGAVDREDPRHGVRAVV